MALNRSGYIGRAPGDSAITIARKTYEPTGVQTDFTFSAGYDPGYCDVYMNGARLINGNDYTASNGSTVGLTSAAQNGDIVEVVAYKAFNLGVPLKDITGDLDITGSVSASSSITAGSGTGEIHGAFVGDGSALTGVASTDYIITGTAATFNSQVKVLNLNVTGVTTTSSFNVGSATTIDGGGVNVTGVITATTFSGNVTGGTVAGSTGTFSGAVNVDATTDSTSTSTGALIVDGGVGIAKNVYIGAGLSVAGTLTYEDVTSVDSVGMVTAKSGVNVSGGQLQVGVAYSVGAAGVATAAGFVGPLTGNVTGNASGTAGGLTGTPNISCGTIAGSTGTFTGDVDIADKIVHTGDTNTALRFPGADTITAETGGSERVRIDSSGRVIIGQTSADTDLGGVLQIAGGSYAASSTLQARLTADAHGPAIDLLKSRNATWGTHTIVQDDDRLGSIYFRGDDGANYSGAAAAIYGEVDGTPGADDLPGRIILATSADGADSPTERIRITADGRVWIGADSGYGPSSDADDLIVGARTSGTNYGITILNHSGSDARLNFADTNHDSAGVIRYDHSDGSMQFVTETTTALTISSSQNLTGAGTISDSLGNMRTIAQNNVSSQQTLGSGDAGRVMKSTAGGLIINTSHGFGLGQAFTFINDSGSDMTITETSTTLYNAADGTTGNKTVSARGMVTGICVAANTFFLAGSMS